MTTVITDTKMCRRCLEAKPASDFYADPKLSDGLHSWCKGCIQERRAQYPRDGSTVRTHGYGGYARGCRCEVCRTAKAARMRNRRRTAFLNTADGPVEGVKHGTRFAYEERSCRCDACVEAKRATWRAEYQRAAARSTTRTEERPGAA